MKSSLLILFLIIASSHCAYADGMLLIYPYMDDWVLAKENQQFAAINYENGIQKMILAIDAELRGKKAVWIFPVPANPEDIAIDVIKGFPMFRGYEVKIEANEKIRETFSIMRLSQLYTIPFIFFKQYEPIPLIGDVFYKVYPTKALEDVTVYEHIEKMGLTAELIGAKSGDSLYNYLINKSLNLPEDSKAILNEYVGKDYSFVVSWISDVEKFLEESEVRDRYGRIKNIIGISISFPTDKIYFPLKPTSVYGSTRIPILIYVVGYVMPDFYPKILNYTKVNYIIQSYYYTPYELAFFFNEKTEIKNLRYTRIKIEAPSKYFNEDLWIKDSSPLDILLVDFIITSALIWGIIFFVLSSCLASILSGMIIFRKEQISKKKFALLGLSNFLTIIGFLIATIFLKTKRLDPKLEKRLKSEGIIIWDYRKILFIILFTILFLVITFLFQIILSVFIGSI